jgi:serine/threonine protein kinase/tetratricopeptide (TPR) repeat protein
MSSVPGIPTPGPAVSVAVSKPCIPDYELVRVVGRGSYGDVWLARGVTGSCRAIKVVWRERFTNAEPFEREFRGLKEFAEVSLGESSQMALLHVGRNDAAGFFYYVMELADDVERGRHIDPENYVPLTLAEMRTRRGRIPADKCARIGVELARVLATLHRRGLVHRDVKPSNVILVSGVPKLADIGLVAPSVSAHTFVGTEGYVPPEGPGAPSADVFALAKVLYELSTGHDRQEFPKLPVGLASFPDRAALLELNEVILRACGPTSADRYRDGAAVMADLTALNAGVSLRTRRFAGFVLRIAAVIGIVAALGLGAWYWNTRPAPLPPPVAAGVSPYSVAVLPFVNATGVPSRDLLAAGISDEILHTLEREPDLGVRGSSSSSWAGKQNLSSVETAKRLRVAFLVEGSLQRMDSRTRLQVRLTRGFDGVSEDLGAFECEPRELFALEERAARAIAQKILPRVTMPALMPSTKNPAAYGAFLRGRAGQAQGVDHAAEAAEHFKQAITLDPDFAAAWARRADALRMVETKGIHGTWDYEEALAAVNRALTLQPDLALAWTVRALIRGVGEKVPRTGLQDLDRAEELGGTNAETRMTRFLLSFFASELGLLPRAREALASNPENIERVSVVMLALSYIGAYAEADRLYQSSQRAEDFIARVYLRRTWRGAEAARQLADQTAPNRAVGIAMRVRMLAEMGSVEEAVKLLDSASEEQPWDVYFAAGMIDRARAFAADQLPELRKKFEAFAEVPRNETEGLGKDNARSILILAEIALGHDDAALALLHAWRREMEKRPPNNRRAGGPFMMNLPRYYALLGEHEAAIEILSEFMRLGRTLGYDLRDSAAFASLRENPRFQELRRQAEEWTAMQPDPAVEPPAPIRKSP